MDNIPRVPSDGNFAEKKKPTDTTHNGFLVLSSLVLIIMSGPPLSKNALAILQGAMQLAIEKGHQFIGTEHLALALCKSNNRAVGWIATQTYPDLKYFDAVAALTTDITSWLESRPLFKAITHEGRCREPVNSAAMERVLEIAVQIGSHPVRDGNVVHSEGLIASEFLLAALLVEGTGVGADAFTRNSQGRVNSMSILQTIHADFADILRPDASHGSWAEFTITKTVVLAASVAETEAKATSTASACEPLHSWYPTTPLAELTTLPVAPTANSNWLIPSKLIIGEHPSKFDMNALLDAGVDTFVSLIGEYSATLYQNKQYPLFVSSSLEERPHVPAVNFMHFPVRDFNVAPTEALIRVVEELKRRIFKGHTVFVHCRGGHG